MLAIFISYTQHLIYFTAIKVQSWPLQRALSCTPPCFRASWKLKILQLVLLWWHKKAHKKLASQTQFATGIACKTANYSLPPKGLLDFFSQSGTTMGEILYSHIKQILRWSSEALLGSGSSKPLSVSQDPFQGRSQDWTWEGMVYGLSLTYAFSSKPKTTIASQSTSSSWESYGQSHPRTYIIWLPNDNNHEVLQARFDHHRRTNNTCHWSLWHWEVARIQGFFLLSLALATAEHGKGHLCQWKWKQFSNKGIGQVNSSCS